jgi:predicted secreted Zn-dependent protease
VTDKPDQLSQSIDDRLAEIIEQISGARDAFAGIAHHASRTIEAKLEQVRIRAMARCMQFQKERQKVNSKVKRALARAKQDLDEWKKSGQSERLQRYADQTEQYALATILDANDAIDCALIAAMESLTARLIAETAARKP